MGVIHHNPFNWVKKLLSLLMVLFCMVFLSACDSSTKNAQPINSGQSSEEESSGDDKDKQDEKPSIIRCAP